VMTVGAREEGVDFLVNGRFERDQNDVPVGWAVPSGLELGQGCVFTTNEGPEGKPSMRLKSETPVKVYMRQWNLTLVPGAKYRLSTWVRTKNFSSGGHGGLLVVNCGWTGETGLDKFPANSDWHREELEFQMIASKTRINYCVVFYFKALTGEIEFADVKLEALDEVAKKESARSASIYDQSIPRLVPWQPLLAQVNPAKREIEFRFFGSVAKGTEVADYDVVAQGADAPAVTVPLAKDRVLVTLPDGTKPGVLEVAVVNRKTGETFLSNRYRIGFRTPVTLTAEEKAQHRRLNSFVVELAAGTAPEAPVSFATERDGWVFVAVKDADPEAVLDGETVLTSAFGTRECFRYLPAGRHQIAIKPVGAPFMVRRVPEILNYCLAKSRIPCEVPYDQAFAEKYVYPGVNCMNGGDTTDELCRRLRKTRGIDWTANIGTRALAPAEKVRDRIAGCGVISKGLAYSGVTLDEQHHSMPKFLDVFNNGLKLFNADYDGDKVLYSWTTDKPGDNIGLDQEYIATVVNASRGRGMILSEIYARTQPTEKMALGKLNDYLVDTARCYDKVYPNALERFGVILGNFNQVPIISAWHHPEVDFKYFLDLQFYLMANDPLFEKLGCVGYWGSYYADEEIHRWSFALTRHYCIKGAKTMLSEKFGYKYLPGILENGDFRGTLDGWKAAGKVSTDKFFSFADVVQRRWGGCNGTGDTFAVLTRGEGDETASLEQTLKGVTAGRKYRLFAATFDVDDLKAKRCAPREIELNLSLEGAETDPELTYSWVDNRPAKEHREGDRCARLNIHRIVFTATSDTVVLKIDNAGAKAGSHLGVNCVSVSPYFDR